MLNEVEEQNNLILDLDAIEKESSHDSKIDENAYVTLNWEEINSAMKPYYIALTELQYSKNREYKIRDILEYESLEQKTSNLFENLLKQWNREEALDIYDYIFERCSPLRIGMDFGDDDYNNPNGDIWPDPSSPSKKILKRFYDAVQIAYCKTLPTKEDASRYELFSFWRCVLTYLSTSDYIWHFLECNMLSEYDGLILENIYQEEIDREYKNYKFKTPRESVQSRLKADISSIGWIHNLVRLFFEHRRMILVIRLYTIFLSIRDLETHHVRVMNETNSNMKSNFLESKKWYEDGIYKIWNYHLESLQSRLTGFRLDLDKFIEEFKDLEFEEFDGIRLDDVIKETENTNAFISMKFKEISNRLLRLSRKIHSKCYDVNFSWVKEKVMHDYNSSAFCEQSETAKTILNEEVQPITRYPNNSGFVFQTPECLKDEKKYKKYNNRK